MLAVLLGLMVGAFPGYHWPDSISGDVRKYVLSRGLDLSFPNSKLFLPGVLSAFPVEDPTQFWKVDAIDLNGDKKGDYVGLYRKGTGSLVVVAFYSMKDSLVHQEIGEFGKDSGSVNLILQRSAKKNIKRLGRFKETQDIYPQIQNDGFRITGTDSAGAFYWDKTRIRRVIE